MTTPADPASLAREFETHRPHLRGVAYRMLASASDAEDAVQETWLRASRADAGAIENLRAWLTTVVARVALDTLRSRRARAEESLDAVPPDRDTDEANNPAEEVELADSVGLALLVVLERLTPGERLAFVLHDLFGRPFAEIAAVLGCAEPAARQLASRARRRVRGGESAGGAPDPAGRREAVAAFLAASREGNFEALLAVLHPDVTLRADAAVATPHGVELRGAAAVASNAASFPRRALYACLARIDGHPGIVVAPQGRLQRALAFTIAEGRIVAIDIVGEPARLRGLNLAMLGE